MEFRPFPKIPRFFRDITITEKIDGTNASIYIKGGEEDSIEGLPPEHPDIKFQREYCLAFSGEVAPEIPGGLALYAGSRNRWITPESDNYGFAKWVRDNSSKLFNLGPGHHFGEWWGNGIQRNYGLKEKRFSLFNIKRWGEHYKEDGFVEHTGCYTVPVLYQGLLTDKIIDEYLGGLMAMGSYAAPGFMKPEGIIIHHEAGGHLYKVLLENDDKPKSVVENS